MSKLDLQQIQENIDRLRKMRGPHLGDGINQNVHASQLADHLQALLDTLASMQARIDSLMLEHCPDEMTEEQHQEWAAHQIRSEFDLPEDGKRIETVDEMVRTTTLTARPGDDLRNPLARKRAKIEFVYYCPGTEHKCADHVVCSARGHCCYPL